MNLYRHNQNKKLYTITHLILDIHHLNNNVFAGIYAYPYKHKSKQITFLSNDKNECMNFVKDNFTLRS